MARIDQEWHVCITCVFQWLQGCVQLVDGTLTDLTFGDHCCNCISEVLAQKTIAQVDNESDLQINLYYINMNEW